MTTPIEFGKTMVSSTVDLSLNYTGVAGGVAPITENVVVFTLDTFHIKDGIPTDGPAPL